MKTIFVVYTNTKLNKEQIRKTKKYSFNTNSDLKEGDMIKSSKYTTPMQVVNVLEESFKYYNSATGELSNTINSSSQNEIVQLEIRNDSEEIVYDTIINVDEVVRSLSKKGVVFGPGEFKLKTVNENGTIGEDKFFLSHQQVAINNAADLGNKSWGKLDFLVNHNGFTLSGQSTYKAVNS